LNKFKGDKAMAKIKINNLSATGSDLFSDSESYFDQLSEGDTLSIQGGRNVLLTIKHFPTQTVRTGPLPTPPIFIDETLPTPPIHIDPLPTPPIHINPLSTRAIDA
jgi:hypothetical protein